MVFVIDDDASVRASLSELLTSVDLPTRTFASTLDFMQHCSPDVPSCLILDVRLPGCSGLDFQAHLSNSAVQMPVIFITGYGDIPMTVRAMKAGAFEFLTKPFRDQDLLDAVQRGLEQDRERRERQKAIEDIKARFHTLTRRERDVVAGVSAGLMNKQIAGELDIAEITVKVHRGNAMRKIGARSLADLIRMAQILNLNARQ
ncbi:MAG: response regulator transcription factor [Hyphomicrobiaceae bacterium]